MANLNRVEIIGRVGANPEMRFTPNGKPVTSFNVATNNYYNNKDGEKIQDTQWFAVVAWGKLAEISNQLLVKGSLVYVTGRVSLHTWDKTDGTKGYTLEIRASQVLSLEKKSNSEAPENVETEEVLY